jgi:hypothetical protein
MEIGVHRTSTLGDYLPLDLRNAVAAVDALEAADRIWAGTVEGGFILDSECRSRIIKLDSKKKKKKKTNLRNAPAVYGSSCYNSFVRQYALCGTYICIHSFMLRHL